MSAFSGGYTECKLELDSAPLKVEKPRGGAVLYTYGGEIPILRVTWASRRRNEYYRTFGVFSEASLHMAAAYLSALTDSVAYSFGQCTIPGSEEFVMRDERANTIIASVIKSRVYIQRISAMIRGEEIV